MNSDMRYIRSHSKSLPDFWQGNVAFETVDAVCNMLAREVYSIVQISEYFECPIELIKIISKVRGNTIENRNREYRKMQFISGSIAAHTNTTSADIYDFQNILDAIAVDYT